VPDCPSDPRQLVGQRDDDGIAMHAALDHSCQPAPNSVSLFASEGNAARAPWMSKVRK
jgi:hypothetical protein